MNSQLHPMSLCFIISIQRRCPLACFASPASRSIKKRHKRTRIRPKGYRPLDPHRSPDRNRNNPRFHRALMHVSHPSPRHPAAVFFFVRICCQWDLALHESTLRAWRAVTQERPYTLFKRSSLTKRGLGWANVRMGWSLLDCLFGGS